MLINDKETEKLIMATLRGTGDTTKERLEQVVEWAEDARLGSNLLQQVLDGDLDIVLPEQPDGDLQFKLTEQGKRKARDLLGKRFA